MRCMMDGHTFLGEPTLLPRSYDAVTSTFTYDNIVFCSPSCAKGWIFRDIQSNTDRISIFTHYCREILGITRHVDICPDPRFLREYMATPQVDSLTIDQFRQPSDGHLFGTRHTHTSPHIDQSTRLTKVTADTDEIDGVLYTTK